MLSSFLSWHLNRRNQNYILDLPAFNQGAFTLRTFTAVLQCSHTHHQFMERFDCLCPQPLSFHVYIDLHCKCLCDNVKVRPEYLVPMPPVTSEIETTAAWHFCSHNYHVTWIIKFVKLSSLRFSPLQEICNVVRPRDLWGALQKDVKQRGNTSVLVLLFFLF